MWDIKELKWGNVENYVNKYPLLWITQPSHLSIDGWEEPRPLCCMYYVYVIRWRENNKFYIGYTNNLQRRIKQHNRTGKLNLIYYEAYLTEKLARTREKKLKYYGSAWRALKKRVTA